MQFMVTGYDGKDEEALNRRLAVREAHIALGDEMKAAGEMLYAVAILDDEEKMIGSVVVLEMASRGDVDAWLEKEPYMLGGVWKEVEVTKCKVGGSFV